MIILIGNVWAVVVQFTFHGNRAERYLIASLVVADSLMEIYLLAISYTDTCYSKVLYQTVIGCINS